MVDNIEDQVKESFLESQLINKKIETALNYMNNTNPVERILKQIGPEDEDIRKQVKENVQLMMTEWIGTYSQALKSGKDLPADLLGAAADLAKQQRKKNEVKPVA